MEPSSPENFDDSTSADQGGLWETPQPHETPETTDQQSPTNDDGSDQPQKAAVPMQKRRRVTRACDECRRKKIKCDGKQPCTHCTVYSYECTYDQPSNRRRNAAPQYIEALENQLKRAKALLSVVLPNIDLNDPNLETNLQNSAAPQFASLNASMAGRQDSITRPVSDKMSQPVEGEEQLESMVKATGQLDLDEQGYWDYHGHSSGLSFVRRLREQFGDLVTEGQATPFVKSRPMSVVFESPKSTHESPQDQSLHFVGTEIQDLPPKYVALRLADHAINDASALLRVVHEPTFYKNLDRIYDTPSELHGNQENNFLPLLYAVLALGALFGKDHIEMDSRGYENAIDEGFKYFKASRQLMDIADCRDLTSLQAVIFMILFLQSSAKLSTCYSYIGVALRSALRMGLHRSFTGNFNPIEAEMRKRIFWVVRKMDTYVGALLGLPHTLSDDDIDQDFPTEVDDENITATEIRPMPEGQISVITACNAHTTIVRILGKIVRYIYPIKSSNPRDQSNLVTSYTVSYAKIRELEKDLQDWLDQLPMGLKPGGEAPPIIIRQQHLLRMAFAHSQMMLYRPFLHYVSPTCKSKTVDQRAFACASACVSVSRNIIHITAEMKRQKLLIGAYWFTMYTTYFAILSLVFFALENPDTPTTQAILRDANEGKETLAQLAKRSMAADRCTATLSALFSQLPERLQRGRETIAAVRKRRQMPSPNRHSNPPKPSTSGSMHSPDFMDPGPPRRAATFPDQLPSEFKRSSFPYAAATPLSQAHVSNLGVKTNSASDFFDPPPSLTPTSASASTFPLNTIPHQHSNQQSFPPTAVTHTFGLDQLNSNGPHIGVLPDMSAMMFPSADPFAYPNQPMTTFENTAHFNQFQPKSESGGFPLSEPSSARNSGIFPNGAGFSGMGASASASPSMNNGAIGTPNSGSGDLDAQLFGPMPMYLMQGSQHGMLNSQPLPTAQSQGQPQAMNGGLARGGAQQQHGGASLGEAFGGNNASTGFQLDDIFNGDEWTNAFVDSGFAGGAGLGGMNGMTGMGMGMGGFR